MHNGKHGLQLPAHILCKMKASCVSYRYRRKDVYSCNLAYIEREPVYDYFIFILKLVLCIEI